MFFLGHLHEFAALHKQGGESWISQDRVANPMGSR